MSYCNNVVVAFCYPFNISMTLGSIKLVAVHTEEEQNCKKASNSKYDECSNHSHRQGSARIPNHHKFRTVVHNRLFPYPRLLQ